MVKSSWRNRLERLWGTKKGTNILLSGILIALIILVLLLATPGFLSLLIVSAVIVITVKHCGNRKDLTK